MLIGLPCAFYEPGFSRRIGKMKAEILGHFLVCMWVVCSCGEWGCALVGVCLCAMCLCLCVKGEKAQERQLCML